jgi:hypothetical protein
MNRAVDSTTTHQSTVGGIHNGIHSLFRDVAYFYGDPTVQKISR